MHTTLCVPCKAGVCFPQSCRPSIRSRWPSKSDSLGIPPPIAGPPGWEAWRGAQNLHSSAWTSVVCVPQFVSHPPSSYGIWFYCDFAHPTISLWLLLCLWMWGIFFGEFQCLPVDDCSAVSCDSGALARGSKRTSFYTTILNQKNSLFLNKWVRHILSILWLNWSSNGFCHLLVFFWGKEKYICLYFCLLFY